MLHKFKSEQVKRACAGDDRAMNQLAEEVIPVLLRWCTRLGGIKVDPEDVAHDVLVVMVARLPELRDPDRFGAWLFQITRKTLATHRRKSWARQWLTGVFPTLFSSGADTDRQTWNNELAVVIQEILQSLPEEQREVVVLCDIEEMTDADAAALLELPQGTLKSRLRLGRKRFQEQLRQRNITLDLLTQSDLA